MDPESLLSYITTFEKASCVSRDFRQSGVARRTERDVYQRYFFLKRAGVRSSGSVSRRLLPSSCVLSAEGRVPSVFSLLFQFHRPTVFFLW